MRVAIVGLGITLLFFVTTQVFSVQFHKCNVGFLPKTYTHFFSRYDLNGYIIKALK